MSRPLLGVENVRGFRYESFGLLPVGHITRATGKAPRPEERPVSERLGCSICCRERTPLAKNSLYFILNNDWFIGWSKLNLWHYDSS